MFAPRDVIFLRKDKWYVIMGYFLILLLITILPLFTIFFQKELITYDVQQQIKQIFSGEDIPFYINNNYKLLHKEGNNTYIYKRELQKGLNLVITENSNLNQTDMFSSINIVFYSDAVYLQQSLLKYKLFEYENYPSIKNIDLAQASEYNNTVFWEKIFVIAEEQLSPYRPYIHIVSVVAYLFESLVNLIFISLLFTFIQSFTLARVVRFSELWKISLYLMTPYAIGSLLFLLFSTAIFYYIGFFMSATYIFIVGKHLQKEVLRRKDNEF